MWDHRELSTREYRQMRKAVEDRIATLRRKTVVRPTVEVLADLVGPNAHTSWDQLVASSDGQRMNAVLRFLFAAVITMRIGPTGNFRLQPHRLRTEPSLTHPPDTPSRR